MINTINRMSRFNQDWAMLNPQPLPPKAVNFLKKPGQEVSLNPQPLPPKAAFLGFVRPSDYVTLNPQPLPPKAGSWRQAVQFYPSQIR